LAIPRQSSTFALTSDNETVFRPNTIGGLLCVSLFVGLAGSANAQSARKLEVVSEADLPRFVYPLKVPASALVEADAVAFEPFLGQARADLEAVMRDYEIQDKAALRRLLGAKLEMQELAGDYKGGVETVDALRAVQEKPASKLLSGLFDKARMEAAIETGVHSGAVYEAAVERRYQVAVDSLSWEVVQDPIKAGYAFARTGSRATVLGRIKTELDPAVAKSGALDNHQAWELIADRNWLERVLPLKEVRIRVLKNYIAAHNVEKPDIWAAREVTLQQTQKLTPVLVAIWDSGVDVSLFPGQVFDDPRPTPSGDHGLAFDDEGFASKDWVHPLTPEETQLYPDFRNDIKGRLDLQNGIDSPEADALQRKSATYTPEQMHQQDVIYRMLGHYAHGTHCAGIAVRGNPAARLVVAGFNDDLPDLPFMPTMEYAQRMKADFMAMSEYFKSRHVRVVNMSWNDDIAEFETWLSRTGGGQSTAERKERAAAFFAVWRSAVEAAIRNAPETLFVAAAGNSDSDTGFLASVPASLHLPNLIAVGAVNQAGDETSFTSTGDTVLLHANGYNVESFVPGGARVRLSGTSMAAPNVVNLAAKLYALDPTLTPMRVVELIRQGATTSEDGRRHLIDPQRTVVLLKGDTK
jgi:subtilisin family serine protease